MTLPYLVVPVTDRQGEASARLLDELLYSIAIGETPDYFNILICLDSVSEDFENTFKDKAPWATFINHTGNPLGFCANSNRGLRVALEHKVGALLVNQDCILPHGRELALLMKDLKGLRSAKSVNFSDERAPIEQKISALNGGCQPGAQECERFAGYCYALSYELMKEVGILWEPLVAGFDDDELIIRAKLAGFPIETSNILINHKGTHIDQGALGQSLTGAYDGTRLGLNLMKVRDRFSIPANIEHDQIQGWVLNHYTWTPELRGVLYES